MLQLRYSKFLLEVGTDEAGRGCLSGPVVAAAVILPIDFKCEIIKDSKQISKTKREALRPFIEENALAYGVALVAQEKIDEINILQAAILAMHRAIALLRIVPEFIIVDGNRFKPYKTIPYKTIVKGDRKFMSIAAASILAKTYRDAYMQKIHREFPKYQWQQNKGYPTKAHREAIRAFGACKYHRKTFKLL